MSDTLGPITVGNGTATVMGTGEEDQGTWVQAAIANTASIWVGGSGVVAGGGLELAPGERVFIPNRGPAELYVIAATAGQHASGLVT